MQWRYALSGRQVLCASVLLATVQLAFAEEVATMPEADAPAEAIDVQQAMGVPPDTLRRVVESTLRQAGRATLPLTLALYNAQGVALANREIIVRWDKGEEKIQISRTGLFRFEIDLERLEGLRILAPAEFNVLKQLSFRLGPAYIRPRFEGQFPEPVVDDGLIREQLQQRLVALFRAGECLATDVRLEQLKRTECALKLPSPDEELLTAAAIGQRNRESVVVVGVLAKPKAFRSGTGFVIHPDGVVATNYHIVASPDWETEALGIMLSDHKVFAVKEILAADEEQDLAIVRIDAKGLPALALAREPAPAGTPVTVLAHPKDLFYYLTQGHVSRYNTELHLGQAVVTMSITAAIAPGSSGGPVFGEHGEVVGMAASVRNLGHDFLDKRCVPAAMLRGLIKSE